MTKEQIEAERVRFEYQVSKRYSVDVSLLFVRDSNGEYCQRFLNDEWCGWLAAKVDASPSGWVACAERMPPCETVVIVVWHGVVQEVTVQRFEDGTWAEAGSIDPWYDFEPSHWMLLPAAPTPGVDDGKK